MSKHTEGPWRVCGEDRGGCQCRQVWSVEDDIVVAVALTHEDENYTGGDGATQEFAEANARLIAAAPELLYVAKEARRYLGSRNLGHPARDLEVKLRAAIAKALVIRKDGLVPDGGMSGHWPVPTHE